ncbi:hypothetical protein KPB05_10235 [Burkholderia gladioli]|uniref:hypothetical protein n=1 Tax=Burkholderia gladioli TaxID=28095 RepID=UPI002856DABA|nr:hypothetical protein [Burkholderia gladioli]MDR8087839.1 hypothetical protein [Burkholderia gladioli]
MVIVQIAYEVPASKIDEIEALLQKIREGRDPWYGWNGVDFKIVRDDFTSVENAPEDLGAAVLYAVSGIIEGSENDA